MPSARGKQRVRRRRTVGPPSAAERKAWENNPFALTDSVYLETSNYCPMSRKHRFCPASVVGYPPDHLPLHLIAGALSSLARYDYHGEVRYHTLNEPLAEPRLFELVRLARRVVPAATITIFTNGAALSQTLADELVDAGTTVLLMTAYSAQENDRLSSLDIRCQSTIYYRPRFDDKTLLGQYDAPETGCTDPCSAPLSRIQIDHQGTFVLCCRDWQKRYPFGSLRTDPLEKLLSQERVWETYAPLRAGERTLPICRRCVRSR